jgi:8-oxo-dGTP pyrophosphatase MutT (NUDIX family)
MTQPHADGPVEIKGKPYVRPRDAATLLILRREQSGPKLLMGRRSDAHAFLPGKFVFPGGKLDLADTKIKPHSDYRPPEMEKLLARMRRGASLARARGLGLAAIRETFEETGLVIGEPANPAGTLPASPAWHAFYRTGYRPALAPLRFIARALTPPGRPRRFDARFFVYDATGLDLHEPDADSKTDELLDLHWLSFARAREQDLPYITGVVITELETRLASGQPWSARRKIPYLFMHKGRFVREYL